MKNFFVVFLLVLFTSIFCFAQTEEPEQPEENWLKEYKIYNMDFINFRYDLYSKGDLKRFREMLDQFKSVKSNDKWDGTYIDGQEVGFTTFTWNTEVGFVDFYVYTCYPELRVLNYGRVENTPSYIQIYRENSKPYEGINSKKYIKVKWGEAQFLVEEPSLSAFAEKAVGIYVEPEETENGDNHKWYKYLSRGMKEDKLNGLPEFPGEYKHLKRLPVQAKIISVGKRKLVKDFEDPLSSEQSAVYEIRLDSGEKAGIRKGLKLYIEKTGEEVKIISVGQNNAIGKLVRNIDEDGKDSCVDGNYRKTLCQKIKPSFIAKSIVGQIWY
ncbi:MAG: hypothetical protein LUM44_20885 [Pyrinomonadaceae bacterium]|nr:hypothetical protein [Pyrinomonadaceae bacterium]